MKEALQHCQSLDHPQFMTVNDGYVSALNRLMIVGMEPTNWGVEEYGECFGATSVVDLMQEQVANVRRLQLCTQT